VRSGVVEEQHLGPQRRLVAALDLDCAVELALDAAADLLDPGRGESRKLRIATGSAKAGLARKFVPADKAAFYKATQPVRDKYGAKYAALLKRIEDTK